MISFFKEKINIHTDNLQSAIAKKANNTSLSGKSLEKLVSIANTQYEFKDGEADFIIRGIPCSTNVNYEKVSNLITEIKSVKPVKDNSFINSQIHSWKVNAKGLLKTNYNPDKVKQMSFFVKNTCDTKLFNMEICSGRKYGIAGKILKVKNEFISFSIGGKKEVFETKKILSVVDSALKENRKTEWLKEETINILSSEVNKTIDAACEIHGIIISSEEKNNIFRKISVGLGPIKLDPKCTQSSISQILYNNKTLSEKINRLSVSLQSREEQNKLSNIINTRLTDQVFMKKFGGIDLNILRKKTAEELALLVKLKKRNNL